MEICYYIVHFISFGSELSFIYIYICSCVIIQLAKLMSEAYLGSWGPVGASTHNVSNLDFSFQGLHDATINIT